MTALSLVIVAYESDPDVRGCLAAVRAAGLEDVEIVLVAGDAASAERAERLAAEHGSARRPAADAERAERHAFDADAAPAERLAIDDADAATCRTADAADAAASAEQPAAGGRAPFAVVSGAGCGLGACANRGLALASGEYVALVRPSDEGRVAALGGLLRRAQAERLDWIAPCGERSRTEVPGVDAGGVLCPADFPDFARLDVSAFGALYRRAFLEEHGVRLSETPGAGFQGEGLFFRVATCARRAAFVPGAGGGAFDEPTSPCATGEDVWAVNREYDDIARLLRRDEALWSRYAQAFAWRRFQVYRRALGGVEGASRRAFVRRWSEELARAHRCGEFTDRAFPTPEERSELWLLINNPDGYLASYLMDPACPTPLAAANKELERTRRERDEAKRELEQARRELARVRRRLADVEGSTSYKAGRAVTKVPRAIKDAARKR